MGIYDRGSKWLIQHFGDVLLRLAGFGNVVRWTPLQAEVISPGQLPDGLIEAWLEGDPEPHLFIFEIGTYPETRLTEQLIRDALTVFLDRRVLPEVVAVLLRPRGRLKVAHGTHQSSRLATTELRLRWRVVELWNLSAEALLALGLPGLAPWAVLGRHTGSPVDLIRDCRELIDQHPDPLERESLLAITWVFGSLRYNDLDLPALLGGREKMLEIPLFQELSEEFLAKGITLGREEGYTLGLEKGLTQGREEGITQGVEKGLTQGRRESLIMQLKVRFADFTPQLEREIEAVPSHERLEDLIRVASACGSLAEFERIFRA